MKEGNVMECSKCERKTERGPTCEQCAAQQLARIADAVVWLKEKAEQEHAAMLEMQQQISDPEVTRKTAEAMRAALDASQPVRCVICGGDTPYDQIGAHVGTPSGLKYFCKSCAAVGMPPEKPDAG